MINIGVLELYDKNQRRLVNGQQETPYKIMPIPRVNLELFFFLI